MSARARVLDALQQLLVEQGPTAVTLEAVADAAGVSKGGLLYHFPSKTALYAGLVDRLRAQTEDDVAAAATAPEGAVRHFLETSTPSNEEAEHYWAVIAALRGRDVGTDETIAALGQLFDRWRDLLREHVDDPVLAEIVRLAGDGIYLGVLAGLPPVEPELWEAVIDRLVALTDEADGTG